MKKIILIALSVLMVFSVVACGKDPAGQEDTSVTVDTSTIPEDTSTTSASETEDTKPSDEPAKGADEMLNATIDQFAEILSPLFEAPADDVKGAFVGGYFSEDETTIKTGAAGKTPIDAEEAATTFKTVSLITDESFAKLDDAAVFHHMMNMNTLAVASMKVANAADVESVANSLKESVGGNEVWICGFPERYVIITIDTYVISAYGNADMVNAVKTAVTGTYTNAAVVADGAFA